ncbi:CBS domain-containing protein [Streptomyces sp. 2A115]|uniref:CBS domain-containing protein n=1 Tax=Streptomyces sp. 2A115 TaxID=3457439 RepID=UPI003FD4E1B3
MPSAPRHLVRRARARVTPATHPAPITDHPPGAFRVPEPCEVPVRVAIPSPPRGPPALVRAHDRRVGTSGSGYVRVRRLPRARPQRAKPPPRPRRHAAHARPCAPVPDGPPHGPLQVPAVSVPGDMPFLDVAHTLAREQLSAVPVVDADDHVIGVVSESDLLAKAAVMAEPHRHGPVGRLRQHRLYEKSHGDTASTLMTFPPVTVHPAEQVADAAWTAAHARLKRLPVTEHRGRLVGVVSRRDLLRALIRDDAEIRAEVESVVGQYVLDPRAVEVAVENGVVTMARRRRVRR